MNLTRQLTAATLALAATFATGAFASEGEALADNAWLLKAPVAISAPAPTATAAQSKDSVPGSASAQTRAGDFNQQAVTP